MDGRSLAALASCRPAVRDPHRSRSLLVAVAAAACRGHPRGPGGRARQHPLPARRGRRRSPGSRCRGDRHAVGPSPQLRAGRGPPTERLPIRGLCWWGPIDPPVALGHRTHRHHGERARCAATVRWRDQWSIALQQGRCPEQQPRRPRRWSMVPAPRHRRRVGARRRFLGRGCPGRVRSARPACRWIAGSRDRSSLRWCGRPQPLRRPGRGRWDRARVPLRRGPGPPVPYRRHQRPRVASPCHRWKRARRARGRREACPEVVALLARPRRSTGLPILVRDRSPASIVGTCRPSHRPGHRVATGRIARSPAG